MLAVIVLEVSELDMVEGCFKTVGPLTAWYNQRVEKRMLHELQYRCAGTSTWLRCLKTEMGVIMECMVDILTLT